MSLENLNITPYYYECFSEENLNIDEEMEWIIENAIHEVLNHEKIHNNINKIFKIKCYILVYSIVNEDNCYSGGYCSYMGRNGIIKDVFSQLIHFSLDVFDFIYRMFKSFIPKKFTSSSFKIIDYKYLIKLIYNYLINLRDMALQIDESKDLKNIKDIKKDIADYFDKFFKGNKK